MNNKEWLSTFKETPMWLSLNESQQNAVALPNENALILAGAGTGKTKTLVARIAALLFNGGLTTKDILSLTFTNKAAIEMKERVSSSLGENVDDMLIGTFHAICYKLVKEDLVGFGYKPNAAIMDSDDQKSLVKRLFRDKDWDKGQISHEDFLKFINDLKEKGVRHSSISERTSPDMITNIMIGMYGEYEKRLKDENVFDFAELLLSVRDRLLNDKEYFDKKSGAWSIILVDEFQDTNPLQYQLLQLLVKKKGAIFAVGDDDQSIYGFRGARIDNIFDFERDCKKENVIRLEQNYRCTGNILGVANDIIHASEKRLGKKLWTSQPNGKLVTISKSRMEEAEAKKIAEDIKRKLEYGIPPEHIAILYRTNSQSTELEKKFLNEYDIPYKIVGGLGFLSRAEVKLVLAHARLLVTLNDVNALIRATTKPVCGIGKKRLDLWRRTALEKGISLEKIINYVSNPSKDTIKQDEVAKQFLEKIQKGREDLIKLGLSNGLANYIESNGIRDVYKDDPKYNDRMDSIDNVIKSLAYYEEQGGKFLDEFLSGLVLLDSTADDENEGAVWMSTIHASKGLEFEHVYLIGWEDGTLPSSRMDVDSGEDEERRLAYVAVTRAKEQLYISFNSEKYIYNREKEIKVSVQKVFPSRFISDIDPKYFAPTYDTEWPLNPLPIKWGKHAGKLNGVDLLMSDRDPLAGHPDHNPIIERRIRREKVNITGYNVGDKIKHNRYGIGTISCLLNEDDRESAKIVIKFSNMQKELLLKYARITKIDKEGLSNS